MFCVNRCQFHNRYMAEASSNKTHVQLESDYNNLCSKKHIYDYAVRL